MKSIVKSVGVLAMAFMMASNAAMACDCGKNKSPSYRPYLKGANQAYYSELARMYSDAATMSSEKGNDPLRTNYFYKKASKAQKGSTSLEQASRKSPDYDAIRNAHKLLAKHDNMRTRGMYPMHLASAHMYYDCWASAYKFNNSNYSTMCMNRFYKHMNMVINHDSNYADDLSISQSKNLERYFNDSHLVGTVYFPFDNYTKILNTDKDTIRQAAAIKAGKDYELVVVGYADRVGTKNYNIDLSVNRAKHVKAWLNKSGVTVEGIDVVAFGESKVSKEYGTKTFDDSANRRVEIYAIKKQHGGCGGQSSGGC